MAFLKLSKLKGKYTFLPKYVKGEEVNKLKHHKLKKAHNTSVDEPILFSDAVLIVSDDDYERSWEVDLVDVHNGGSLNEALRNKKHQNIEFTTEGNDVFQGSVLIQKIKSGPLGVDIRLIGNGKLTGYDK